MIRALGKNGTEAREAIRITLLPGASVSDARRIARALKNVVRLDERVIE